MRKPELLALAGKAGPFMAPVALRRSKRAHRLKLSVDAGGVVKVTVPWNCPFDEATAFAREQGVWIEERLSALRSQPTLLEHLKQTPLLSADGQWWRVECSLNGSKPGYRWLRKGDGPRTGVVLYTGGDLQSGLQGALRLFASATLERRTMSLADSIEIEPPKVQVRDQSSRWGSCSGQRTLSLNWRLVLLPAHLQDYVIYHELAHLSEMNHQAGFWRLLQEYDPKAREHDRQLSLTGAEIFRLGRA